MSRGVADLPTLPGAAQQPAWPDRAAVDRVRATLAHRPDLVTPAETAGLRAAIAAATEAGGILVQGGDCAERFGDSAELVQAKIDQLHAVADALRATGVPVVPIGRVAGQFGKPRSQGTERTADGRELPSYRGDIVNDPAPTTAARTPDPDRLLAAYDHSAATLAQIRRSWAGRPVGHRVHTSHELLVLDYEEPLTRGRHASSAHFGWIGERTRAIGGRHVALAASVDNPVGVKLGPTATAADVVDLSRLLNPDGVPGRLAFIVRMGADLVAERLPDLLGALRRGGPPALWVCDPMHGNTVRTATGRKTRAVGAIRRELEAFTRAVRRSGAALGGVHLEMTPDNVTECVDGDPTGEWALPDYRSVCDPRLNPGQVAELTDAIAGLLRTG